MIMLPRAMTFVANRQRPFALAVLVDLHLDDRERIIDRARPVSRFPETDRAIGGDHNAPAAVFAGLLMRVAQVVTERIGRADGADGPLIAQQRRAVCPSPF